MRRKLFVLGMVLLTGLIVGGMTLTDSKADVPDPVLTPVVEPKQEEVNTPDQITNSETDKSRLQTKKNTSPSSNGAPVTLPAETTPTESNAEPTPPTQSEIKVVGYEEVLIENSEDKDCKVTYSDGRVHQWHWIRVDYSQGSKITYTSGRCDDSLIGMNEGSVPK